MPRSKLIIAAILPVIALLALAVPLLVVRHPPKIPPVARGADGKVVVPKAVVPPVEPVTFQAVTTETAQAINAAVPFSTAPNPAAKPYYFRGGPDDLSRARDCLAAAMWYEAGDDAVGERAVGQVVLNRVRHPAFPGSVCSVVFQGSDRRTGCQFTFTCDGAMVRVPSPDAWDRARALALAALSGSVYAPVGLATHYHTDWVVPYWSSSLDKITEVHTHLFFRWAGWWGTPPAFRGRASGSEPAYAKLAFLSPAHGDAPAAVAPALADDLGLPEAAVAVVPLGARAVPGDADTFYARLDPARPTDSFRQLAVATCAARARCKFLAWIDSRFVPTGIGLSPQQMGAMAFSYLRDRDARFDKALWNCNLFPGVAAASCMKRQASMMAIPATPLVLATPTPRTSPVPELSGVRRRATDPAPAPSPTSPAPRTTTAATPSKS